jgi:hypothetical protein
VHGVLHHPLVHDLAKRPFDVDVDDNELFVDELRLGDAVATRKVEGAGPEAGEAAERVGYARLHP